MKKGLFVMLLAGMLVGSACSAAAAEKELVQMAQEESKTPLDVLCSAVYEAVKVEPSKAVDVFKSVMGARDTWTASETYAVLRSILIASPSLESGFVQSAAINSSQSGGYAPVAVESLGYQLFSALYTMPQTQSVAGVVTQSVAATTITGDQAISNGVSAGSTNTIVPAVPVPPSDYPIIPTPDPTSPNN